MNKYLSIFWKEQNTFHLLQPFSNFLYPWTNEFKEFGNYKQFGLEGAHLIRSDQSLLCVKVVGEGSGTFSLSSKKQHKNEGKRLIIANY